MADSKKWIQKAINPANAGKLRKTAKVRKGKNIPMDKLTSLAHSSNKKTAARARLAMTLRKMNASRMNKQMGKNHGM